MEMNEETQENEMYLYLDFDDRIPDNIFLKKVFFRLAKLESKNPLIQINDLLFKGEYEDCVGTNLFFEEDNESSQKDSLFRDPRVRLKHTATQFKTLRLEPLHMPNKLNDIPEPDYGIKINDYDYETVLKKLTDGSLNLEDDLKIVPKNDKNENKTELEPSEMIVENTNEVPVSEKTENLPVLTEKELKNEKQDESLNVEEKPKEIKKEKVNTLKQKYEKLKKLARRPTKRKIEPEKIEECEPQFQKAYEYNSIKSQVIKPSDYFPFISKEFNKDTLVGAVDINRSILQGVIKPTSDSSVLSEKDKTDLLSMENLENLSMFARYCVVKTQLEHLEMIMSTMDENQILTTENEFKRSIKETQEIYKRLVRVLNGLVQGNYSYNSGEDTDDDYEDT